MADSNSERRYDVVIIGGALAGASAALLLLREQSTLRVLIIEKSTTFGRRVGEATVEVSAYFLARVLGLTQYLNESHLVKQGMRFWFAGPQTESLADCSEIGSRYMARVPAYQVDRATLDEEVLRRAVALGAELWRPAAVQRVELVPGGEQIVTVNGDRTVRARWVVDASGAAAYLARQQGWWRPNTALPTAAAWARWRGVKDWDGYELAQKFPMWAKECYGVRGTATNHLTGHGWWAWLIPLKGGDVSVGVVFDQRLVHWPENGSPGQRLKDFLVKHPIGRELLGDAHWIEGDVHWRKNLPYFTTTFAGDGFALVGDAAGFLDPLYSPGMDWMAYTVSAATQLIFAQQRSEKLDGALARHNRAFARSYARWFAALYQDKYEYLGEYDLMRLTFMLDVGLYYLGVVSQPYLRGPETLRVPTFSLPVSTPFYWLIRAYNRRFAQIARARRRRNELGRRNQGRRFLIKGLSFEPAGALWVLKAMAGWGWLELTQGWRSWGRSADAT